MMAALAEYCDVSSAEPSHWSISTGTFSRLDHMYCNLPEWILVASKMAAGTLLDPLKLRPSWDSDHVPLWVSVSRRNKVHHRQRPIDPRIFSSKTFAVKHASLVRHAKLETFKG